MPRFKTVISFYLSSNTLRVSTKAIRELDSPSYVRFLVNPDKELMAMESYDRKEFTSFRIQKKVLLDSKSNSFRIRSKKFCQIVARQMGWDAGKSYRVPGNVYHNLKVAVYRLEEASVISGNHGDD